MGPKDDTSKEMIKANTTTDNELLPGLGTADHEDPKVKGSGGRLWASVGPLGGFFGAS